MVYSSQASPRHRSCCRDLRSPWRPSSPSNSQVALGPLIMAVNLTPQYMEAEEEYKKARTPEEKEEALKKMWALLPKHKASEKLQAQLKTKISDVREAVEAKKHAKKAGVS